MHAAVALHMCTYLHTYVHMYVCRSGFVLGSLEKISNRHQRSPASCTSSSTMRDHQIRGTTNMPPYGDFSKSTYPPTYVHTYGMYQVRTYVHVMQRSTALFSSWPYVVISLVTESETYCKNILGHVPKLKAYHVTCLNPRHLNFLTLGTTLHTSAHSITEEN